MIKMISRQLFSFAIVLGFTFVHSVELLGKTVYVQPKGVMIPIPEPKLHRITRSQRDCRTFTAGDTLYIRGGTYAEIIDSKVHNIPNGTDWTPGSGAIIVKAYPGETVWLAGHISLVAQSYQIWDGINIDQQGILAGTG